MMQKKIQKCSSFAPKTNKNRNKKAKKQRKNTQKEIIKTKKRKLFAYNTVSYTYCDKI